MKCKKCNHEIKEGATFCAECGFPVNLEEPEEKLFCNQCGRRLPEGQKECLYCSGKIPEGAGPTQKNSEKMMIIGLEIGIVVIVGIIIGLIYFNFFKREKTDNTTDVIVNGEVDSDGPTSTEDIPVTTEQPVQEIELPGVIHSNKPNYENCTSLSNYQKVIIKEGEFSFGYPEHFFNKVEKEGDNYTFTSEGEKATLIVKHEKGSGDKVSDVQNTYKFLEGKIDMEDEKNAQKRVADKEKNGWTRCIYTGLYIDDPNQSVYFIGISNGKDVYTVDFEYSDPDVDDFYTPQNYMIDCLYRLCDHSGADYEARTYEQFLADDSGTKKSEVKEVVDSKYLGSYKQITEQQPQKVGDVVYSLAYHEETQSYIIYVERDGRKEELIQDCKSSVVVTNGTYLYYATGSFVEVARYPIYENRCVNRYTIESGTVEAFVYEKEEGVMYAPFACDDDYLYIGTATQYGGAYGTLYVLSLKDKKLILAGNEAGDIQEVEGKLLVSATEFPHGGDLYFINRDGTGYQSLTEEKVSEVEIKEEYIYFTEARMDMTFRQCRCRLDGTNKETLTDWSSQN